jgi:lipoprotein-anchoring transpeptidase ErfK/SrfK
MSGDPDQQRATTTLGAGLPDPVAPAFVPGPLHKPRSATGLWAVVNSSVVARAEPDARSEAVSTLATRTPEGTPTNVFVLGRMRVDGRLWVHVRLPVLPNDRTAWVPRRALGAYIPVYTRLVVDLGALKAVLYRGRREIFSAPIGVGTPDSPTPTGHFYIRNKLTRFASQFYGPVAFGTSARSAVQTDWPGGGFIGIHGTNVPELIPGRVSHGCIRLRNEDVVRLAALMRVGTPVVIR